MCAASVFFTKLPKVNSHPIGENSPNLVTLLTTTYFILSMHKHDDSVVTRADNGVSVPTLIDGIH
jgi:hypothetical protein